jgi:hypothetical protein
VKIKASTEGLASKTINMVLTVCGKETVSNFPAETLLVAQKNSVLEV